MKHIIASTLLFLFLVACTSQATSTAPQPIQQVLLPPPSRDLLLRTTLPAFQKDIAGGAYGRLSSLQGLDTLTLGRPSREASLTQADVLNYQPSQQLVQLAKPTGRWVVPILVQDQVVALAFVTQSGQTEGAQFLSDNQPPPLLVLPAAYNDPSADVWTIDVLGITRQVMLVRGTDERLIQIGKSRFFKDLDALADQEVPVQQMMVALQAVVNEKCRVWGIFWQC